MDETINEYGGLDVFVNNAGIFPASIAIERMEQKVWDRTLEVNLTAAMIKRGWNENLIQKLLGENWLAFLEEVWGG